MTRCEWRKSVICLDIVEEAGVTVDLQVGAAIGSKGVGLQRDPLSIPGHEAIVAIVGDLALKGALADRRHDDPEVARALEIQVMHVDPALR